MLSPYKLCDFEKNFLEIATNYELATELENFFKISKVQQWWKINTHRQTVSQALRNTENIPLRIPILEKQKDMKTSEWNQITDIINTEGLEVPIFKKTVDWLEAVFKEKGANKVEFGRIFFSKLLSNSQIDEHTDEGKYFDYYDRFHYVVDQIDEKNIFCIRNEHITLKKGNLYWVNNHVIHWLENKSDQDRINLIFDARIS